MARPDLTDLIHRDDQDDEHEAWINACDKLNQLLREQRATTVELDVNDPLANEFVDAIRWWGECLALVRGAQAGKPWREAKHIVEHGRPARRPKA